MKLPLSLARPRSVLRDFLAIEAAGGIILLVAAAFALFLANSAASDVYFSTLHHKLGPLSVIHWINDALMALFFLLVGLEVKREFLDGHLSTWADRRLPVTAAIAGMIVPALVYIAFTGGEQALLRGWAIPAATDIAFAIGILALLGQRAPAALKLFLTTVAIADDIGAVAIIAIAYTKSINGAALFAALCGVGVLFLLNRAGITRMRWYFAGFVLIWVAVQLSGVHATIAGVLTALAVPVRLTPAAPDAADSTLHRMEHLLSKPVAFFIVPLFGLANAGVAFGTDSVLASLPMGIAAGLFIGKQVGIFGAVWLMVRLGYAQRPGNASWTQIYGTALLCGIGFTMSLFIGDLAFTNAALSTSVKQGVLIGSGLSAIAGYAVLWFARKKS